MTYDNRIEMATHENTTRKTGIKFYFSHSYSSWERGTIFNLIDKKNTTRNTGKTKQQT